MSKGHSPRHYDGTAYRNSPLWDKTPEPAPEHETTPSDLAAAFTAGLREAELRHAERGIERDSTL